MLDSTDAGIGQLSLAVLLCLADGGPSTTSRVLDELQITAHQARTALHTLTEVGLLTPGGTEQATADEWALTAQGAATVSALLGDNDEPDVLGGYFRGCLSTGFDHAAINTVASHIEAVTGVRLVCLWNYRTGNRQLCIEHDGQLFDLAHHFHRWLAGPPDDPQTPIAPGEPSTWTGFPLSGIDPNTVTRGDGRHNLMTTHPAHN